MKNKRRQLVKRHVLLKAATRKEHSSLAYSAMGRIEREYILLTGEIIHDDPDYQEILNVFQ